MTDKGIKTVTGLKEWNSATIPSILKNEKYKGDAILQKTYVPDYIKKKAIENKGELDKYYLADDHPPIVSRGVINDPKYNNKYPYTGMLYCSKCGAPLRRKAWNSKTPFKKYVWQCSNYINKSKRTCTGTKIDEKELEEININGPTIIREELRDGKKYYSYTSNRE